MRIEQAAEIFLKKTYNWFKEGEDRLPNSLYSVPPIVNAILYLTHHGEYDHKLEGGNVSFEFQNCACCEYSGLTFIKWYEKEYQVTYYDLPESERQDRTDWTLQESFFRISSTDDGEKAFQHVLNLHLVEKKSNIILTEWQNGVPVEEIAWEYGLPDDEYEKYRQAKEAS